jgi:hypothetical protein
MTWPPANKSKSQCPYDLNLDSELVMACYAMMNIDRNPAKLTYLAIVISNISSLKSIDIHESWQA